MTTPEYDYPNKYSVVERPSGFWFIVEGPMEDGSEYWERGPFSSSVEALEALLKLLKD